MNDNFNALQGGKEENKMKKLTAILAALILAICMTAALAEEEILFTMRNGVVFGMSMDEVIATETEPVHEIEREHTYGGITFDEVEYEHVIDDNIPMDIKYLFVDDQLAAVRINYETRDVSYEQMKADLVEIFGEFGPVDLELLGRGIYAVDDDGRLERNAEAAVNGTVMVLIELDEDDIDVTVIDLNAAYLK